MATSDRTELGWWAARHVLPLILASHDPKGAATVSGMLAGVSDRQQAAAALSALHTRIVREPWPSQVLESLYLVAQMLRRSHLRGYGRRGAVEARLGLAREQGVYDLELDLVVSGMTAYDARRAASAVVAPHHAYQVEH